jgi:ubiquinone/menaquinone biosynthesis C-methylase UbiE
MIKVSQVATFFHTFLKRLSQLDYDLRSKEYEAFIPEISMLKNRHVLDLACGTGTYHDFLSEIDFTCNYVGIDLNPKNVEYCVNRNISCMHGNATQIPLNNLFGLVHCSHLIQVMDFTEVVKLFQEVDRVLDVNGLFILTTLSDFRKFFRHPENRKPYPPEAILRLINSSTGGSTSPMQKETFNFKAIRIVYRKPPLIKLTATPKDEILNRRIVIFAKNLLTYTQYKFKIVGPKAEAYSILFRKF